MNGTSHVKRQHPSRPPRVVVELVLDARPEVRVEADNAEDERQVVQWLRVSRAADRLPSIVETAMLRAA